MKESFRHFEHKKVDLIGLGNAIVDIIVNIEDEFLEINNLDQRIQSYCLPVKHFNLRVVPTVSSDSFTLAEEVWYVFVLIIIFLNWLEFEVQWLWLINFLQLKLQPKVESEPVAFKKQRVSQVDNRSEVVVEGVGNLLTHIAKCCQPIPGDSIDGFISQGKGISVHRQDCEQLKEMLKNVQVF